MAKATTGERQAEREARQHEREARWRKHVEMWRAGGTSQAAYCRRHGLAPVQFSWWKHALARRAHQRSTEHTRPELEKRATFVALRLAEARTASVCEVELRNGRRLRLASGVDSRWVAELASALEQALPC